MLSVCGVGLADYSRKGRDCVSLSFSSCLPFEVWHDAVSNLQAVLTAAE